MWWMIASVIAPFLYVLSIGPALYFGAHEPPLVPDVAATWMMDFYTPVLWLRDHTPHDRPLDTYVNRWLPMEGL